MSSKSNIELIESLFKNVLNRIDPESINYIVAKDYFENDLMEGQMQGCEGVKERLEILFTAFPDARYSIEDIIAGENKIAVRWIMTGTHKGTFLNISPTGKQISLKGIDIYLIKNNSIISHWSETDMLGLLNQIRNNKI